MQILTSKTNAPVLDKDSRARLAKDADEIERYYLDALEADIFPAAGRFWRLYLAKRPDPRKEHEKWRANVTLPYPFSTAETQIAQIVDINTGTMPYIQAEGVDDDDYEPARHIEKLLDYTLIGNYWRRTMTTSVRALTIQGTDFLKAVWGRRAFHFDIMPGKEDIAAFEKALQDIIERYQVAPPPVWHQDPVRFAEWKSIVEKSLGVMVPNPPKMEAQPQTIVQYEGPMIERVPFWDIRMDPHIQEMRDQHCIIQRLVKPMDWLKNRTGDADNLPYDPKAVEEGMASWDGEVISQYERELAEAIGIGVGREQNPYYKNAVEIMEKWTPGSEYPFQVILNRKSVINKHPNRMPYMSGQTSLLAVRKLVIPGFAYGMSTLMQPEALFYEGTALRNLRLDAVTLATLPILTRLQGAGLPELQRKLSPASIIEITRADALKQLNLTTVPTEAFREIPEIKLDIDETEGTGSNVRGAAASVNRVSASENQSRLQQAMLRGKLGAVTVEEDLSGGIPHWLALWAQFGPDSVRVRVGGKPDAVIMVGKDQLLESLHTNFRFRGATRAINRDQTIQNLQTLTEKFKDVMHPAEVRAAMKVMAETMNIPQVNRIVSDKVTAELVVAFEKQKELAAQQAAQQKAQNDAAQATAAAPDQMPVDQAKAAMEGGEPSGTAGPAGPPPTA